MTSTMEVEEADLHTVEFQVVVVVAIQEEDLAEMTLLILKHSKLLLCLED